MATISLDTRIPILGTNGFSGFPEQSQLGDILIITLKKMLFLASMTGLAYSTNPAKKRFVCSASSGLTMAFWWQVEIHFPQPMHLLLSITTPFSVMVIASTGQSSTQALHFVHFVGIVSGKSLKCIAIFPAGVAIPMEAFLIQPPKPEPPCPLK